MTHFDIGRNIRTYFFISSKSPLFEIGTLLLIPVLTLWPIRTTLAESTMYCCIPSVADCFCKYNYSLPVMVALFSFYMFNLQKYDFAPAFIIRQKSKQQIWRKQCFYTLFTALLIAIYSALWVMALGLAVTGKAINWNDAASLYCFYTDDVSASASMLQVVGVYIGVFVLTYTAMSMLVLFLQWLTNYKLVGFLIILAIPLFDNYPESRFSIYYRHCGISQYLWTSPHLILNALIYPILWIIVLYFLGYMISKRKDFFNVHQKEQS